MNPERPSKKQSEHFLPSVGEFHIEYWLKEKDCSEIRKNKITTTAEQCLPVWRQFARFSSLQYSQNFTKYD